VVDALNQFTNYMAEEKKAGDDCKLVDGTDGYLAEREGGLVCVPKEVEKAAEEAAAAAETEKADAAPETAPEETSSEEKSEDAPAEEAAAE